MSLLTLGLQMLRNNSERLRRQQVERSLQKSGNVSAWAELTEVCSNLYVCSWECGVVGCWRAVVIHHVFMQAKGRRIRIGT